jgi:MurNAc alpha-1-phosphate uridylyltransferase
MSHNPITKGFILAAGKGERMRPLTNDLPKPLLEVDGLSMLDRALDMLEAAGVTEVVVNAYYLADKIEAHLKNRTSPKIILSKENSLLDTGGGVKNALAHFGDEPFYVLNGDVVLVDDDVSSLKSMAEKWDGQKMDLLLLVCPLAKVNDPDLKGDYSMNADGQLAHRKRAPADVPLHVFAGPRIVHPRVFQKTPDGAFSFVEIFNRAEDERRLYGLVYTGDYYHVGTPEMLAQTNQALRQKKKQKNLKALG